MPEKIRSKDFVEIDYTGKEKNSGIIFDTTIEEVAKKNKIYSEKASYKPVVICIGEKQILPGLDKKLTGKETDKDYEFELEPEEGFGKKNPKLMRIIPLSVFNKQKMRPFPGMQINVDNVIGIVKTVGSGRVIVDFNHPLSGKKLVYDVKAKRIITDKKEKISAYLKTIFGVEDAEIELKDDKAKVKLKKELPEPIKEPLSKKLSSLIGLKRIDFEH